MRALWRGTFDESERFLDGFYSLLPDIGGAAVALDERGARIGAAYALTGYELLADGKSPHIGYVYAVAVEPSARGKGIGSALTKAAGEICREREAVIVTTLPAEESLYAWYERAIDTRHVLCREKRRISAEKKVDIIRMSATEYMLWRENLLRGRPHVHLSYPMLETQRLLCEAYGGGLYASSEGVFAAYRDGDRALIREILCAQGDPADTAASAAAYLGCSEALYDLPATAGGARYIASDTLLPDGTVWNLTLD